ncbi:hypothetical protein KGA66_05105 [Actinocrinis puniceicyclus]|uniref:Uncharacterized protein n=2 Tax=Actinocrinis puniceicyclus TaxID=977794 RepID=A0A8J7WHN9_9ACTN|nr:hypothetical protein [Actinocrinis puniceicyclus]
MSIPAYRRPRGRVAQTLLLALIIAVNNLRRLEQFLRDRHENPTTLMDHLLPENPASSTEHDGEAPSDTSGGGPPTG